MAKVHRKEQQENENAGHCMNGNTGKLRTLHEAAAENIQSAVSIVNTADAMRQTVEELAEHVDHCNIAFKNCVMTKVKALKQSDTTRLTERVEEMKGQESSELSRLHAIYTEKKVKTRQMEGQVSIIRQVVASISFLFLA